MLGEEDDVAVVKSSDCGGGSNKWVSGFEEHEEIENSEEIGRLDTTLSRTFGDCFRVSTNQKSGY